MNSNHSLRKKETKSGQVYPTNYATTAYLYRSAITSEIISPIEEKSQKLDILNYLR